MLKILNDIISNQPWTYHLYFEGIQEKLPTSQAAFQLLFSAGFKTEINFFQQHILRWTQTSTNMENIKRIGLFSFSNQ